MPPGLVGAPVCQTIFALPPEPRLNLAATHAHHCDARRHRIASNQHVNRHHRAFEPAAKNGSRRNPGFSYDTFCSNKVRFALTALGMVIGTASLILVVTI